jgi:hypothetical protein
VHRRLWQGCKFTHDYGAAVEDIRRRPDFRHLPHADVPRIVREHGVWTQADEGLTTWNERGQPDRAGTAVYRYVKLFDGTVPIALKSCGRGWYSRHLPSLGWSKREGYDGWRCTRIYAWDVTFVEFDSLCYCISRKHGYACEGCGKRNDNHYGECRDCEYWSGPAPWEKDLPRLIRKVQRAAKAAA